MDDGMIMAGATIMLLFLSGIGCVEAARRERREWNDLDRSTLRQIGMILLAGAAVGLAALMMGELISWMFA